MILETVSLTLPIPNKALWPNGRPNRWAKARATKNARVGAQLRALAALNGAKPPRWEKAETKAVFFFATNRRRDADGCAASLKAVWDGIADAGLVANDAGFTHAPPELQIDKANPRVEITITRSSDGSGRP